MTWCFRWAFVKKSYLYLYWQFHDGYFQVMLDTIGPELQVVNKSEKAISLQADASVVLTPNQEKEASSELLPINFTGLSKVCLRSYFCRCFFVFSAFANLLAEIVYLVSSFLPSSYIMSDHCLYYAGSKERRHHIYWPVPFHRKWNYFCLVRGRSSDQIKASDICLDVQSFRITYFFCPPLVPIHNCRCLSCKEKMWFVLSRILLRFLALCLHYMPPKFVSICLL